MAINAAEALINLIKIAEKDIQNGCIEPAKEAFAELRKELVQKLLTERQKTIRNIHDRNT